MQIKFYFWKQSTRRKNSKLTGSLENNEKMFKDENERPNQMYSGLQYTFFNWKGRNQNKKSQLSKKNWQNEEIKIQHCDEWRKAFRSKYSLNKRKWKTLNFHEKKQKSEGRNSKIQNDLLFKKTTRIKKEKELIV
jgi:hypothetical protein